MGSSKDYVPRRDTAFHVWASQFETALSDVSTTLGVTEPEVTALSAAVADVGQKITDHTVRVATQQAATAAKKEVIGQTKRRIRALAQRIKKHPSYTQELGERLGIVATTAGEPQFPVVRPTLTVGAARNGNVAIRFLKNGFSGVQIASRRADGEFVVLKTQLRSPFIDERVNLLKGPETRYYQARYLDGDNLVGEASDILVVTVPE